MVLQEGLVDVKVSVGDSQNGPQYHRNQKSKTYGKIVDNVNRIVQLQEKPAYEFTEHSTNAINSANAIACNHGCDEVTPAHLALAMVTERKGLVLNIMKKVGIDPSRVELEMKLLVSQTVSGVPKGL